MAKKTTLDDLSTKIDALTDIVEKGFAAVADDIADVRRELKGDISSLRHDVKGDIVRLQEQVTSIEGQLRNGRYESRLTKLESEVFGASGR
jgi:hypothetical protein